MSETIHPMKIKKHLDILNFLQYYLTYSFYFDFTSKSFFDLVLRQDKSRSFYPPFQISISPVGEIEIMGKYIGVHRGLLSLLEFQITWVTIYYLIYCVQLHIYQYGILYRCFSNSRSQKRFSLATEFVYSRLRVRKVVSSSSCVGSRNLCSNCEHQSKEKSMVC